MMKDESSIQTRVDDYDDVEDDEDTSRWNDDPGDVSNEKRRQDKLLYKSGISSKKREKHLISFHSLSSDYGNTQFHHSCPCGFGRSWTAAGL